MSTATPLNSLSQPLASIPPIADKKTPPVQPTSETIAVKKGRIETLVLLIRNFVTRVFSKIYSFFVKKAPLPLAPASPPVIQLSPIIKQATLLKEAYNQLSVTAQDIIKNQIGQDGYVKGWWWNKPDYKEIGRAKIEMNPILLKAYIILPENVT